MRRTALFGTFAIVVLAMVLIFTGFAPGGWLSSLLVSRDDAPRPTVSAPPGMTGESFAHFAFARPAEWTAECRGGGVTCFQAWVDANDQTMMHASFGTRADCPDPEPLELGPMKAGGTILQADSISVPGAGGARRYVISEPPLGDAVWFHIWSPSCAQEMDLTVWAPETVADEIVNTVMIEESGSDG